MSNSGFDQTEQACFMCLLRKNLCSSQAAWWKPWWGSGNAKQRKLPKGLSVLIVHFRYFQAEAHLWPNPLRTNLWVHQVMMVPQARALICLLWTFWARTQVCNYLIVVAESVHSSQFADSAGVVQEACISNHSKTFVIVGDNLDKTINLLPLYFSTWSFISEINGLIITVIEDNPWYPVSGRAKKHNDFPEPVGNIYSKHIQPSNKVDNNTHLIFSWTSVPQCCEGITYRGANDILKDVGVQSRYVFHSSHNWTSVSHRIPINAHVELWTLTRGRGTVILQIEDVSSQYELQELLSTNELEFLGSTNIK